MKKFRYSFWLLVAAMTFVIAACGGPGITPPTEATLTVNVAGSGTGSVTSTPAGIDCPGDCSQAFETGTEVTLTATPADGNTVTWANCDSADGNSCTVTVDENMTVTATFDEPVSDSTVTVNKAGTGTGTVTSEPAGIDCGDTCAFEFEQDALVTLTATPDAGSTFAGWEGCTASETEPTQCVVEATGAPTVTATFNTEGGNGGAGDLFNISSRTPTSASVDWTPPNWTADLEAGADQRTPNLASIVGEIVGLNGWSSGNAMVFLIEGPAANAVRAYGYEEGVNFARVPELVVEYTVDGTPGSLSRQVSAIQDDAEEFRGNVVDNEGTVLYEEGTVYANSDLELTNDPSLGVNQYVGIRFRNVEIPAGATIDNAHIQFTAKTITNGGGQTLTIRGEANDNPDSFPCMVNPNVCN